MARVNEDHWERIEQVRRMITGAFTTRDGRLALKYLEETYQSGAMFDPDPIKMAYKVAQYDLVEDIKRKLEDAVNE